MHAIETAIDMRRPPQIPLLVVGASGWHIAADMSIVGAARDYLRGYPGILFKPGGPGSRKKPTMRRFLFTSAKRLP